MSVILGLEEKGFKIYRENIYVQRRKIERKVIESNWFLNIRIQYKVNGWKRFFFCFLKIWLDI